MEQDAQALKAALEQRQRQELIKCAPVIDITGGAMKIKLQACLNKHTETLHGITMK